VPPIRLGERTFEIALARRVPSGDTTTTRFDRHGSTPITVIPAHWLDDYRDIVPERLDAIESVQNIRLIEQPEYRRRWNMEPWADQQADAKHPERFVRGVPRPLRPAAEVWINPPEDSAIRRTIQLQRDTDIVTQVSHNH
jgi:hypothetical protein